MRSSPVRHLAAAGICHQFLWPVSQPVQFCEHGTVRRGANSETASEPSQVQGQFRALHRCSYPEGYGCYCTTSTQRSAREGLRPSERPGWSIRLGAQRVDRSGEWRGMATTRQPSELGAVPQTGITQLQVERSLRGKRSDPSHGANAAPQALAVPVVKVPERMYSCRRPSTRPASEPPAGGHRTGRRGLTR